METTDDYRFWVSLSQQKFDHKPDRITEVGKLKFTRIYKELPKVTVMHPYSRVPLSAWEKRLTRTSIIHHSYH